MQKAAVLIQYFPDIVRDYLIPPRSEDFFSERDVIPNQIEGPSQI
jgi:hypothetical protein